MPIQGTGSDLSGVVFNSGAQLNVEKCEIFGFTQNGISENTTTSPSSELSVTYDITNRRYRHLLSATNPLFGIIATRLS